MNYQEIFNKLLELQNNSVCDFSHYRVAAVLETEKGNFEGVNVEPSVMNLGVCAERNALFSSLTKGAKHVKKIWLITDSKENFGSPCGACRQLLVDYCDDNTTIVMFNLNGEHKEMKFFDLLPMKWTKKELN